MRWIPIVFLAFIFNACTALKPVINKNTTASPRPQPTQPVFIETITTGTTASTPKKAAPSLTNERAAHTFNLRQAAPEIFNPVQFKYAIMMDVPVEALSNLKLFAFIDDWYGTPYRFGGNSKAGIDCSAFSGGLMTAVYGIGLPRMAKDQYTACEHVKRNNLEEGDLVFFHTTRKGISHVGVYLGNNKFVHASLNYGVVISDLTDPYYARTFRGGGRTRQTDTAAGN